MSIPSKDGHWLKSRLELINSQNLYNFTILTLGYEFDLRILGHFHFELREFKHFFVYLISKNILIDYLDCMAWCKQYSWELFLRWSWVQINIFQMSPPNIKYFFNFYFILC